MGWSYNAISTGTTPASAVSAFEAAITRHPDAISWTGYPSALFTKQISQAKAAGITLVSGVTGDGPVPGVLTDVGGKAQEELFGKLVASYFVAHAGSKGKAGIFNLQALPVLGYFVQGFQTAVKQWCPSCSTTVINQQLTDEGTKTPANVVAYLQRNPDVKWTVFSAGDLAQGVRAAINTSGLHGINIAGEVPSQTNIANLKAGTETAWAGYLTDVAAWRVYDILARHFVNADVATAAAVPLPLQMITADNVGQVVVDGSGYYLGVADYQAEFKKLWRSSWAAECSTSRFRIGPGDRLSGQR